jgi:putative nucleotidyltransferase with HDIG domain
MSSDPLTRDRILDAVWHTDQLPPYPGIVAEVERELAKSEPSPARLGSILSRDPALCASILRVANSAAQAARSEATTVSQAVIRLGLRQVRRVVLTSALVQRWPAHRAVDQKSFWNHSIAVALVASELGKHTRVSIPADIQEATFTAGVLHDLGAMLLARTFPEHYAKLAITRQDTGRSAVSLELENWGIDHGEVGGIVACRWHLPERLRDAVAFHHQPWQSDPSHRLLTQLIHVADFLCSCQGICRTETGIPDDFDNATWDDLGLRIEQAYTLFEGVNTQGELSRNWVTAIQGSEKDQTWRRNS